MFTFLYFTVFFQTIPNGSEVVITAVYNNDHLFVAPFFQETLTKRSQPGFMPATSFLLDAGQWSQDLLPKKTWWKKAQKANSANGESMTSRRMHEARAKPTLGPDHCEPVQPPAEYAGLEIPALGDVPFAVGALDLFAPACMNSATTIFNHFYFFHPFYDKSQKLLNKFNRQNKPPSSSIKYECNRDF